MRNRWIYMSFKWNFDPITENSYCNRSNLSVIGKKIINMTWNLNYLTFLFMSFMKNKCKEFYEIFYTLYVNEIKSFF